MEYFWFLVVMMWTSPAIEESEALHYTMTKFLTYEECADAAKRVRLSVKTLAGQRLGRMNVACVPRVKP